MSGDVCTLMSLFEKLRQIDIRRKEVTSEVSDEAKQQICGCSDVKMEGHHATQFTTPDGTVIKEGHWITLDGYASIVFNSAFEVLNAMISDDFGTLMS